jgi:hypothetical protein
MIDALISLYYKNKIFKITIVKQLKQSFSLYFIASVIIQAYDF